MDVIWLPEFSCVRCASRHYFPHQILYRRMKFRFFAWCVCVFVCVGLTWFLWLIFVYTILRARSRLPADQFQECFRILLAALMRVSDSPTWLRNSLFSRRTNRATKLKSYFRMLFNWKFEYFTFYDFAAERNGASHRVQFHAELSRSRRINAWTI